MKKTIAFLFAALASTAVFAEDTVVDAMNMKVYNFTVAKDACYKDGTALLAGERVIVVGTKKGCTFTGIDAAGKPLDANTEVIGTPMEIELGKKIEVQVSADLGLTLRALILDSRMNDDVAAEAQVESMNHSKVVIAGARSADLAGQVVLGPAIAAYSVILCDCDEEGQFPVVQASGIPTTVYETLLPRIAGIKVLEDGKVDLTLRGLGRIVPCELRWAATVDALAGKAAGGLLSVGESSAVDKVGGLRANPGDNVNVRIWVPKKLEDSVSAATFFELKASDAE